MMIARWRPLLILLAAAELADAQGTGTFVDRLRATDLRLMSYNVEFDTIFPDTDPVQAPKIARLIQAVNPNILALQEIYNHTAPDVVSLMNSLLPQPGTATWYGYKSSDNVIMSKYPLSLQRANTTPSSPRGIAIALVDLPNAQFVTDFYLMNNHFRCCGDFPTGPENMERQRQADALVNWMRDARTSGGNVDLPANTPMAVVGDLNIVGGMVDPLNTLLSGNIFNEGTYGSDSPPDWDGTSLTDSHPLHNVVGPDDYTWRNDSSIYNPGRLDYVLYTDSAVGTANRFILNSTLMTPAELAATGLQQFDSANSPGIFDHLPLVVDFRFPSLPGDYNSDGTVNTFDYDVWRAAFGAAGAHPADGNSNGVVDTADYAVWREHAVLAGGSGLFDSSVIVPEPGTTLLAVAVFVAAIGMHSAPVRFRFSTDRPGNSAIDYFSQPKATDS